MNIVITGASSGIGFQTALQLSRDTSHQVFVISRSDERLDTLREEALHLDPQIGRAHV